MLAILGVLAGRFVRDQTSAASMERRLRAALGARGDSLYRVRVASSHLSVLDRAYLATGIEIVPDSAAFRARRAAGHPVRDRFSFRAASFRVTGLDVWGLLRHRLQASTVVAESLEVEVALDRTVPAPPDSIRRLPHEFFRSIPRPFRVDSFRIEHSLVRYFETEVDGVRPGVIRFADTHFGVYNLNNDPLRPSVPVVIDVRTLLAGSAPTTAVFEYDFSKPKLNLNYEGSVRDLDAQRLNEMLVDLQGIRLNSGVLDTAWFKFQVTDGVANGDLQMRYRHLSASFLNKRTRKGGLADLFKSFVANSFMLRGHNRADGDHRLRTATIRGFAREPSFPLPKFVWHTLREGLFVTVQGKSAQVSPGTKEVRRKRH